MHKIYYILIASLFVLVSRCSNPVVHSHNLAWADSTLSRALALMGGPKPEAGIYFLDSAFSTKKGLDKKTLWRKYRAMANYYEHHSRDTAARRTYVDSMIWASQADKETSAYEYSHSLYAMAKLLRQENRFNDAFRYYYEGRRFAKGKLDNCSLSDFSNALGVIRYQQGHYRHAVPYLRQAYAEVTSCTTPSFEYAFILPQSILNSIALCFENSGEGDSAVAYYHKALNFIRSKENLYPENQDYITVARGVVEGNLGGAYIRLGRLDQAEKHLKADIWLNDRPGFAIEDAQTAKAKLAGLYIQQGRLPGADALLDDLQKDLVSGRGKSSYHAEMWARWYLLKSDFLQKKGEATQALYYFKRYHAYRDSLEGAQKGFKDIDVDQLLRQQDQRHKLGMLQKSDELKNMYLYGLAVFLAMAIAIAAVIWHYYRRSRQNVRELTSLNGHLEQALAALENSQAENVRLMKVVAHDLRGPIGAMAAIAEVMLDEPGRIPDDQQALTIIKDTGNNSLELVNNLMHLNDLTKRIEKKDLVDLAALVRQCADMLGAKAREKRQTIDLQLDPVKAVVNYEQFWRVISNLLSNAIKFSPQGAKISVSLSPDSEHINLFVQDEGIGIPPEMGNQIFDVFTDSRRKGTAGEDSFGLGLSITRQIISAHGGLISYTSAPGSGTTFHIQLPKP